MTRSFSVEPGGMNRRSFAHASTSTSSSTTSTPAHTAKARNAGRTNTTTTNTTPDTFGLVLRRVEGGRVGGAVVVKTRVLPEGVRLPPKKCAPLFSRLAEQPPSRARGRRTASPSSPPSPSPVRMRAVSSSPPRQMRTPSASPVRRLTKVQNAGQENGVKNARRTVVPEDVVKLSPTAVTTEVVHNEEAWRRTRWAVGHARTQGLTECRVGC